MKVVIDIEGNALVNPDQIWLIVCQEVDTGKINIFRGVTHDEEERKRFIDYARGVSCWIGHNILGYDYPVLHALGLLDIPDIESSCLDTLILSKLIDYPRKGHSIASYGEEFGEEKGEFHKWGDKDLYNHKSDLFLELEKYCLRDVSICLKVYLKYYKYLSNINHKASIRLEHSFQLIVNQLETNGFSFNVSKANKLLDMVTKELLVLDTEIHKEFPPRLKVIREVTPKATKYGTISLSSIPKALRDDIAYMTVDAPFCHCEWQEFNPSSHKQLIEILNAAGWQPTDKTVTHIETERELNRLKHSRQEGNKLDLAALSDKLKILKISGFKINETNLDTLPPDAPSPARSLARRILLESRRRTLTEWLNLATEEERIHGNFYGIGAWTHRMAHQSPNTANIPGEFDTEGNVKLLGKEMRQLWRAPKNRLLVGVDAEGIQLRIFAHYINDQEFTDALVRGRKEDRTDPHSLNQRILGSICKTRAAAKRFIYALLLGGGLGKLAQILNCSTGEAEEALNRLLERYTGFAELKASIIPKDASRGYFIGLDGRRVRIPGDTVSSRKHLAMSGYLQNGEAVVVKATAVKVAPSFRQLDSRIKFVDIVHDEYVIESPNDVYIAEKIKDILCQSIEEVGKEFKLLCPLKGDGGYGLSWYDIH